MCACLLLFNAVVCVVFGVLCDGVCCVCVSRVFVYASGLIVFVCFVCDVCCDVVCVVLCVFCDWLLFFFLWCVGFVCASVFCVCDFVVILWVMLQGLQLCVLCVCVRGFLYACGVCEVFGDVVWYVLGCVLGCVCVCFCMCVFCF